MPVLNFREIPEAHRPSGRQDQFEFFARETLELIGYRTETGPDRGQDGGRDLIVQEVRTGIGGMTNLRWLVSCKHKAHSGQAIGVSDEVDLRDRVEANGCNGFIGFYSTVASSALTKKLANLSRRFEHQIFDSERIEQHLLGRPGGLEIALRYFPASMLRWRQESIFQATLLLEGNSDSLTDEDRRNLRMQIARVIGVDVEQVRIVRIEAGSIRLTFQAPLPALGRLLDQAASSKGRKRLKRYFDFRSLEDLSVILGNNIELEQLESGLFISRRLITFGMFSEFSPTKLRSQEQAAVRVSWQDAQEYCSWLSHAHLGDFRLPTEQEWETAARGGRLEFPSAQVSDLRGNLWEWCTYWRNEGRQPVAVTRIEQGGRWYELKDSEPLARREQDSAFRVIWVPGTTQPAWSNRESAAPVVDPKDAQVIKKSSRPDKLRRSASFLGTGIGEAHQTTIHKGGAPYTGKGVSKSGADQVAGDFYRKGSKDK